MQNLLFHDKDENKTKKKQEWKMYLIDVKRKIGDLRTVGRAGVDI